MYNVTEQNIIQALQNFKRWRETKYLRYILKAQAQYNKAKTSKHGNETNYYINIYSKVFNVNKQEFLQAIENI